MLDGWLKEVGGYLGCDREFRLGGSSEIVGVGGGERKGRVLDRGGRGRTSKANFRIIIFFELYRDF